MKGQDFQTDETPGDMNEPHAPFRLIGNFEFQDSQVKEKKEMYDNKGKISKLPQHRLKDWSETSSPDIKIQELDSSGMDTGPSPKRRMR